MSFNILSKSSRCLSFFLFLFFSVFSDCRQDMELEHVSVHFSKNRVELVDKKNPGRKVCAKWAKCHHLVDTLRKDQSYKYILVTQNISDDEQEITLVKTFDREEFLKANKIKKWCCLTYTKLIACFELDQINMLCDRIEMYSLVYHKYEIDRVFENNFIIIILGKNNYYHILDKQTKLEKKISPVYWYWMYCLVNRLSLGIENTIQTFLLGHDNVHQKVLLHMTNCTKLSLMSYTFKEKTLTTIEICSNVQEMNQLKHFVQQTVAWIEEPFLGAETNFWFKTSFTPDLKQCGYWCRDCKLKPTPPKQEDVLSFLLMDVF